MSAKAPRASANASASANAAEMEALTERFAAALAAARKAAAETDDRAGACNFDAPVVTFDALSDADAARVLAAAGVSSYPEPLRRSKGQDGKPSRGGSLWVLSPPIWARGATRTAQAEAMVASLKGAPGIFVTLRYVTD